MLRTAAAASVIAIAGLLVLSNATDGFRALTSEGARRLAVVSAPRPVPGTPLIDMNGQLIALRGEPGELILAEFIYTMCPTVCTALGESFALLQRQLASRGLSRRVRLVSVSFDLAHDDLPALREYAARYGADGRTWTIARPRDEAELRALLDAFGVIVIPDGVGGYVHNAGISLLDNKGQLRAIYDLGEEHSILAAVERGP